MFAEPVRQRTLAFPSPLMRRQRGLEREDPNLIEWRLSPLHRRFVSLVQQLLGTTNIVTAVPTRTTPRKIRARGQRIVPTGTNSVTAKKEVLKTTRRFV